METSKPKDIEEPQTSQNQEQNTNQVEEDDSQKFAENDLNREKFDYIVFGSGLTENILGAALSIAGHKCLFLDQADRYGGSILNFNLEHYLNYIQSHVDRQKNNQTLTNEQQAAGKLDLDLAYHDFTVIHPFNRDGKYKDDMEFRKLSRNFNIDLQPKILFSKSLSVSELIRSGVNNYLEFQSVADNYFYSQSSETFQQIPFSKSEVFSSSLLSFKEKRQLVKVMEACLSGYDKIAQKEVTQAQINSTHIFEKEIEINKEEQKNIVENKDKPIRHFLDSMGIEKKMQDILLYAIGNVNENQFMDDQIHLEKITTFQFFERIQKYLRSIGYYGDSPFMVCVYGTSEYSQAFSRIGSLHSCIYIVNEELKISEMEFEKANDSDKLQFKTVSISYNDTPIIARKGVIVGPEYQRYFNHNAGLTSDSRPVQASIMRLALITTKPLMKDQDQLATFVIPPHTKNFHNANPIRVFQMNHFTYAVTKDHYLILASTTIKPRSQFDDDEAYQKYLNEQKAIFQQFLLQFYSYQWDTDCDKTIIKTQENQVLTDSDQATAVDNDKEEKKGVDKTDSNHGMYVVKGEESGVVFATLYIQDYRQEQSQEFQDKYSNVTFIKDTPFDSDIDSAFNEAQQLYNDKLGLKDKKFLKRPDSEEEMYAEMNKNEYDDEDDEENIIKDLQNTMVNDADKAVSDNNKAETEVNNATDDKDQLKEKQEEDQLLNDLLDDLINDE
eukprot:403357571